MARREREDILQGITPMGGWSVANERNSDKQKEDESWQRSLQMANMAAKMDPYTSLGFSLGNLLFANAGNWFGGGAGGRNADGTKSGAENIGGAANPGLNLDPGLASAAGLNPNGSTDMNQFGWNGQDVRESIGWQPKPGEFGSPEYAGANGISIQKDTIAPTDNGQGVQATSTTFSASPSLDVGGYKGIDDFQFQPLIDSEFNPANADNWRKKNGVTGFFGGLRMGGY